jgi:hypothetical protein
MIAPTLSPPKGLESEWWSLWVDPAWLIWIWIVGRFDLGFSQIGAYFREKVKLHFFFFSFFMFGCLEI